MSNIHTFELPLVEDSTFKSTYQINFPIPYGHQEITDDDVQAVVETLKSDWLTQGPKVPEFEEKIAAYCGTKYAVAVCNATAGLHLACLALDLEKDSYGWTSPNSFVASANCLLYSGLKVDFVDIDERTYNMDVSLLEEKLKTSSYRPSVVIPVHYAGQSCDMEKIYSLGQKYGFKIIEDAAHAMGSRHSGQKVGSCQYSDISVFSFHPVKIMTTGEGGVITTNNEKIYKKLLQLRTHGITRTEELLKNSKEGPWYYEMHSLGYNYRLTDIQAALGISQLQKLDLFVNRRREIAKRYKQELNDIELIHPLEDSKNHSSYHLYPLQLKPGSPFDRKTIVEKLNQKKISANVLYIPIHTQPYYQNMGFKKGDFVKAEKYYENSFVIPIFSSMSYAEQSYVIHALKEIFYL